MLSRRLIFSTLSLPYSHFSSKLESIDNYLNELKYLAPINNIISIYGVRGDDDLRIGREITGREEEAYFHEEFKIEDYDKCEFISEIIDAKDLGELKSKIESLHLNYKSFRVQWDLSESRKFKVYFF